MIASITVQRTPHGDCLCFHLGEDRYRYSTSSTDYELVRGTFSILQVFVGHPLSDISWLIKLVGDPMKR